MIDTKNPGAAGASGASEGDWLGGNRAQNTKRTSSQQQRDDFDVAPAFSDEAIALEFAETFQEDLRYVAETRRWMVYEGGRWKPDKTLDVYSCVRATCRKHANNAPYGRPRDIASAKTVAGVERLARADDRFCATADQWDSDPWLLNTPAGVIDLRLGANFGHSPHHYMTHMTAVAAPMLTVDCPLWHRFLERITGGDDDLQGFLARIFGYMSVVLKKCANHAKAILASGAIEHVRRRIYAAPFQHNDVVNHMARACVWQPHLVRSDHANCVEQLVV